MQVRWRRTGEQPGSLPLLHQRNLCHRSLPDHHPFLSFFPPYPFDFAYAHPSHHHQTIRPIIASRIVGPPLFICRTRRLLHRRLSPFLSIEPTVAPAFTIASIQRRGHTINRSPTSRVASTGPPYSIEPATAPCSFHRTSSVLLDCRRRVACWNTTNMSMYPHRPMGGVPPGSSTRLNELLEQIRAEFETQLRQTEGFEHQSESTSQPSRVCARRR